MTPPLDIVAASAVSYDYGAVPTVLAVPVVSISQLALEPIDVVPMD